MSVGPARIQAAAMAGIPSQFKSDPEFLMRKSISLLLLRVFSHHSWPLEGTNGK
jgi:hypothetical protein